MSLKDFANVVISTDGPAISQVGFGTLLCAAFFPAARFGNAQTLVKEYSEVSEMVTDGFTENEPAYKMVARAFQQKPRPPTVKVGRLATAPTQTVKFKLNGVAQNNTLYGFTMKRNGVTAAIQFNSDGTATEAEIVAGLAAAVEASALGAAVAATSADTNTSCQIVEGTPGTLSYYSDWTPNLKFSDVTTDPGITADLDAIKLFDDDFYGLAIDHNCNAIGKKAADWAETQSAKMAFLNVSDSDCFDSLVSTDLCSVLKALSYARTMVGFDYNDTEGYSGVALAAERFPHDPGAPGAGGTWHAKTLTGVSFDRLSTTQKANLRLKNYVVYISTANVSHTLDGKVAGGEYGDKIRGLDWFKIRSEEAIFAAIKANDKIPYTDRGISIIQSCVDGIGAQAMANELFVPGSYSSKVLSRSQTQTVDRQNRRYRGLTWSAELAGAIHLVDPINGSVTS